TASLARAKRLKAENKLDKKTAKKSATKTELTAKVLAGAGVTSFVLSRIGKRVVGNMPISPKARQAYRAFEMLEIASIPVNTLGFVASVSALHQEDKYHKNS